ncbi:hypothetical protein BD413DRAFT_169325 [Trametes elegans]|nr:hypothetical protein BD413DRAFT_169325 [Trametes elegans]
MFSNAIQPSVVSLFSSTGSDPLSLFSEHTDAALPSDSFTCILDDATSEPAPPAPRKLISVDDDQGVSSPDYTLGQSVLHIQSPTTRTTFIRCPPKAVSNSHHNAVRRSTAALGLKHPWIHLQVRSLRREWAFEVGIVDQSGREGIIRCATFQREPKLKLGKRAILVLPLTFPPPSSRPLTSWSTIALHLPTLLPHFSSAALARSEDETGATGATLSGQSASQVPGGTYSHVSYVKVYATCRLRRIWFSEGGPQQRLPWEFELYASE